MRSASVITLVALSVLVTCSSPAADGDSCEAGADCTSGTCFAGTCEGSDCTCEGADCRARSSCMEGWLCTRGGATPSEVLPRCRKQCTGAGTCPSGRRCANGICQLGAESFALSWTNLPRATLCSAGVPCEYKLRVVDPAVVVETFTWTFAGRKPVDTKEPANVATYSTGGSFEVVVRAQATSGGVSELRTTEVVCVGGLGAPCEAAGSPCCEGSCGVANVCK